MKFDQNGTKLWEHLYNVGDHESSANLCLTPEGGFIFSGMTDVNSFYGDEVVIIKTDGSGNQLSIKILSLGYSPEAWGLEYQNGNYIFYGGTTLATGQGYYLLLMRFNL